MVATPPLLALPPNHAALLPLLTLPPPPPPPPIFFFAVSRFSLINKKGIEKESDKRDGSSKLAVEGDLAFAPACCERR